MDQHQEGAATTDLETARNIMGKNLISVGQVEKCLGIHLPSQERAKYRSVSFSPESLRRAAKNCIVFAGVPLSVHELFVAAMRTNSYLFSAIDDVWFLREPFAIEEKVDAAWYCIDRRVNPLSLGKTFEECQSLLQNGLAMPRACELFYLVLLYYLATHKHLFRGFYPFCQETGGMGVCHLLVGFFSSRKGEPPNYLDIRGYAERPCSENFGIVAAEKVLILPEGPSSPIVELAIA